MSASVRGLLKKPSLRSERILSEHDFGVLLGSSALPEPLRPFPSLGLGLPDAGLLRLIPTSASSSRPRITSNARSLSALSGIFSTARRALSRAAVIFASSSIPHLRIYYMLSYAQVKAK